MITSILSVIAISNATKRAPAFEDLDHVSKITILRTVGNKLYVGGRFERANRKLANNIAVWDGTDWSTLGKGVDGEVKDICAVGNDIYVCGDFSYVNKGKSDEGTKAYQVAKWNGTAWAPLAKNTVDRQIFSLATDGKRLFVGGNFKKINDSIETSSVAMYDGNKFVDIGGKFDRGIYSMAWFGGKLFVAGFFQEYGDDVCANMAVWDGAKTWSEVAGVKGSAKRLAVDGDNLYVAGDFPAIKKLTGGKFVDHVGLDGSAEWVYAAAGKLYIAGSGLNGIQGKKTYQVGIFDGKTVSAMDELLYAKHLSVIPFGGATVIGGSYGDVQADGIGGVINWKGGRELDILSKSN